MITEMKPAVETVADLLEPRKSMTGSVRTNARRNANKAMEASQVFEHVAEIAEPLGIELRQPHWNGDAFAYSDALMSQLVGDKVGRLEYEGDKIRFHWFEARKEWGVFQNTLTRERHEHLIVNPRFLKLPYQLPMPKKASLIHNKLCAVPALRRSSRVLTGTLVGEAKADSAVWEEETWLTQTGKAIGSQISSAANATAAAAGGVVRSIGEAGTAMMNSFAADPALVIGNDIVLFGWKD